MGCGHQNYQIELSNEIIKGDYQMKLSRGIINGKSKNGKKIPDPKDKARKLHTQYLVHEKA